jgi:hypothetical protein
MSRLFIEASHTCTRLLSLIIDYQCWGEKGGGLLVTLWRIPVQSV